QLRVGALDDADLGLHGGRHGAQRGAVLRVGGGDVDEEVRQRVGGRVGRDRGVEGERRGAEGGQRERGVGDGPRPAGRLVGHGDGEVLGAVARVADAHAEARRVAGHHELQGVDQLRAEAVLLVQEQRERDARGRRRVGGGALHEVRDGVVPLGRVRGGRERGRRGGVLARVQVDGGGDGRGAEPRVVDGGVVAVQRDGVLVVGVAGV